MLGIDSETLTHAAGNDWSGYSFGPDGLFYVPCWRRGFSADEIRALFYETQMVRMLKREATQARLDLARALEELEEARRRADFYRRNLTLESKLGLALSRIAG